MHRMIMIIPVPESRVRYKGYKCFRHTMEIIDGSINATVECNVQRIQQNAELINLKLL